MLLLVAGGYAVVRALERASMGWLAAAGVALGFGPKAPSGKETIVLHKG